MSHLWQDSFALNDNQMWAIKEAFTILLNLEASNLRFELDKGYPAHKKIRLKIKNDWIKHKNFEKVLDNVCSYVKKNRLFV
jgi:hypothetical protein